MDFFEHLGHCCGDELRRWGKVCEDDRVVHRNRSTVLTCGSGELGDLVDSSEMQRFRKAAGIDAILQTFSPEKAMTVLRMDAVRQSIACILIEEPNGTASVMNFARQLRENGSRAIPCVAVARKSRYPVNGIDLQTARQSLLTRFKRRGRFLVEQGLVDSVLQINDGSNDYFGTEEYAVQANLEAVARAILTAVQRRVDLVVPYDVF